MLRRCPVASACGGPRWTVEIQVQRVVRAHSAEDIRVQLLGHELPLTMRVEEAARLVGVGRSSMYSAVKRGEFPTMRINGRTVVLAVPLLRRMGLEVDSAGLSGDLVRPRAADEES